MTDVVIRAEGISKQYVLGQGGRSSDGLRHALQAFVTAPFRRARRAPDQTTRAARDESFWALRDVGFDVRRGEAVGIIGRNGAGKSTLLKILSRITDPTSGRIGLKGRVSSLLEVGTGFHPELTGRENIYLNGAVLGMRRREITSKFDEIVAFAEIETFLDTPVKRYSSGMYVRLAFAVAAHLDPDVLIVDEVLAVGDAQFQRKCLDKMGDVAQTDGRTVLFVSHNMAAIGALCGRALLLSGGRLVKDGHPASDVVAAYLASNSTSDTGAMASWSADEAPQAHGFAFRRAWIEGLNGVPTAVVANDAAFAMCVEYSVAQRLPGLRVGFALETVHGILACGSSAIARQPLRDDGAGLYRARCEFPGAVLNEGRYQVRFGAETPGEGGLQLLTPFCLAFDVVLTNDPSAESRRLPGIVRPALRWDMQGAAALP